MIEDYTGKLLTATLKLDNGIEIANSNRIGSEGEIATRKQIEDSMRRIVVNMHKQSFNASNIVWTRSAA